jgi:DNA-binding CsgD family transcriptional regulator
MTDEQLTRLKRLVRQPFSECVTLDAHERRVANLCAQGWTLRQVASEMDISPSMANYHMRNALPKLGVKHKRQLSQLALATIRAEILKL